MANDPASNIQRPASKRPRGGQKGNMSALKPVLSRAEGHGRAAQTLKQSMAIAGIGPAQLRERAKNRDNNQTIKGGA